MYMYFYCLLLFIANSADDKLVIFFFHFSQKTGFDISCIGDNLHEISNPVFWEK